MKKLLLIGAIAISLNSVAQVPAYVPSNGLIAWYPFNGNANDESGNNLNGTVVGANLTSDRFGTSNSAFSFDGVANEISVAPNSLLDFESLNTMSYSYWIYANSFSTSQTSCVISKQNGDGATQDGWYSLVNQDSLVTSRIMNGNGTNQCTLNSDSVKINSGQDYHIVHTYNNGTLRIYVNGVLTSEVLGCNGQIGNSNSDLVFGAPAWTPSMNQTKGFNGTIDDIGIWNTVLSECEI